MKNLIFLSLVAFATSCFNPVLAMPGLDAGSINSSAVRDLKMHEISKRNQKKIEVIKEEQQEVQDVQDVQEKLKKMNAEASTTIKYVSFTNNSSISSKELFSVAHKYLNLPMNINNISAIRKDIMKYYRKKGFYSAIVMVSSENIQSGELVLDIKEGGRNSITVEK